MMKIADWLHETTALFENADIDSARLDSLILLEAVLGLTRVDILTNQNSVITTKHADLLSRYRKRRLKREPIAYIIGSKEFYGRSFKVNSSVLIPRPESETIVDMVKELPIPSGNRIADVGTGSGVLAITIALEIPNIDVVAYDIDPLALKVAQSNNASVHGNVTFNQRNLLDGEDTIFNVIVANLPYVSDSQDVSPETLFEPKHALLADNDGLELILLLIAQIHDNKLVVDNGYVILESEPRQHAQIEHYAEAHNLRLRQTVGFIQLYQINY